MQVMHPWHFLVSTRRYPFDAVPPFKIAQLPTPTLITTIPEVLRNTLYTFERDQIINLLVFAGIALITIVGVVIINEGQSLAQIAPHLTYLSVISIVLLTLSSILFKWSES